MDNKEITIFELLAYFKTKYKFILTVTAVTLCLGLGVSFFFNDKYQSVLIAKVSKNEDVSASTVPSEYNSLANLAGISLPSADQDKTLYVIEKLKSKDFFKTLLEQPHTLESVVAVDYYDKDLKKLFFDQNQFSDGNWVRKPENGRLSKPSHIEAHEKYLEIFNINLDKESNFLKLTVTHESPVFAYNFLNLILNEINRVEREKDFSQSLSASNYLYELLEQTKISEVSFSINKLLEVELKKQMLTNINQYYILEPIDMPFMPEVKISPLRINISLISVFLGVFFSILYLLLRKLVFIPKPE